MFSEGWVGGKSIEPGIRVLEFEFFLCFLVTILPWVSHLEFHNLSFLIIKWDNYISPNNLTGLL